jgi:pimeloyl-ACP methyl ester carboxylesterase
MSKKRNPKIFLSAVFVFVLVFFLFITFTGCLTYKISSSDLEKLKETETQEASAEETTIEEKEVSEQSEIETTAVEEETTTASSEEKASIQEGEVTFTTEDEINLNGNIFGAGEKWAVLSHMYPTDQQSWFDFAKYLKQNGFGALTFDFRGYGKSEGEKDISKINIDLEAAVNFLKKNGIERIYLIGASMGGTACLVVAADEEVNGVIAISAPMEFKGLDAKDILDSITCPKLFIATEGDGDADEVAQEFYNKTAEPKAIEILGGNSHGTFIFEEDPANAELLKKLIIEFLQKY